MPWNWSSHRGPHRLAARALIVAATVAVSTASASAFVPDTSWSAAFADRASAGAHHAPSGANVIGRGIGGLHGDLADAYETGTDLTEIE